MYTDTTVVKGKNTQEKRKSLFLSWHIISFANNCTELRMSRSSLVAQMVKNVPAMLET